MEKAIQILSRADPPQFAGYWGYGQPSELNARLVLLMGPGAKLKPIQSAVALSASQHFCAVRDADAWCRVEGDTCHLGRAPFGRVPLYWTQVDSVLWFASRSQLLLPLLANRSISLAGLYGYSCFSYVPTPLTPIESIFAVPTGTELIWQYQSDSNGIALTQTRRLLEWREHPTPIADETTAIAQLQALLKAAIERQIDDLPDEPVGVLLSGGLDSSLVAALLVQAGLNVRAYTLDFGSVGISEHPYAEQVAQWLNIPIAKVDIHPKQVRKTLSSTVQALDLPFGDGVTVPLFLLNQAARQEVSVIFNGEGGDQLFAGWTNKPLIAASLYQTQESFSQHYLRTFHRLWGYESQVYTPEVWATLQTLNPEEWLQEALDPSFAPSLLHRLRRANLMLKGAQNIHPRATQLGFAHGLKVRSPFCDLPLAEWTFQVAGSLFLQGACEKYILKRAVEPWLPPEIVWRKKRGMGVPLSAWCFQELWADVGYWLNPGVLRKAGYWHPHLAAQIAAGRLGGQIQGRRIGETLWLLMMWEIWRSQVFGAAPSYRTFDHPFWLPHWIWKYGRDLG